MANNLMERFAGQSQLLLAAILDQSNDCIKLLNRDGEVDYINDVGRAAMEIADASGVIGQHWRVLWPEDSRKAVASSIDKALRGQRSRFQALGSPPSGQRAWWDVSVGPVYDDEGEIRHILATSRDVTDYMNRHLNDQLRREEAEREADLSDAVAREMRHRLKNQLAVVASVAKLIARHSDTARQMSEKLEGKISALAQAQDLLTIHREEPITAAKAIEQVLGASGAGDRIEVLTVPEVRLGDDAIQQLALILGELQTNALKYGALAGDEGKITLSAKVEGKTLCLHWHEDTGRPIEPPSSGGSGMLLLQRLGSAGSSKSQTQWHRTGPAVTFYLRLMD